MFAPPIRETGTFCKEILTLKHSSLSLSLNPKVCAYLVVEGFTGYTVG